jgi:hypothetical protein
MRKIKERDKTKFYEIVMEFHNGGLSYIDSICKVIEILNLKYIEVVRLMKNDLKEEVKKEGIEKHLLKCKKCESIKIYL